MLIGKLSSGVLRVLTPLGPRYIKPTFRQRIYLLWIFRNFDLLPLQVLSARQRQLIEALCGEQQFVSVAQHSGIEDAPILGTVERRPPVEMEAETEKRPSARAAGAPVGGVRQGS
jgi:hypothetical protein